MSPRHPCAHDRVGRTTSCGDGLGRHGPVFVVGSPIRSLGYGVVPPPRIRVHGAPNETHHICAEVP